jgi:sialic acid synthase SpsE
MNVFIIAEIGINHNGDLNIAKKLIDGAAEAGCDAVKFQKRTIDVVYSKEELDKPRESPWGTTNREQKNGLEFSLSQYKEIDAYCASKKIAWFASAWDVESQKFLRVFNSKYNKVASAMLGHTELLKEIASEKKHTFISTGMSTLSEIDKVVELFKAAGCPFELMHCNSTLKKMKSPTWPPCRLCATATSATLATVGMKLDVSLHLLLSYWAHPRLKDISPWIKPCTVPIRPPPLRSTISFVSFTT